MKNKIVRAFALCLVVALLAAAGFLAFQLTKDRAFFEAAVAAGILFLVLLVIDVCFAVVAVRERKRLRDRGANAEATDPTERSEHSDQT